MKRLRRFTTLAALSVFAIAGVAAADDDQKQSGAPTAEQQPPKQHQPKPHPPMQQEPMPQEPMSQQPTPHHPKASADAPQPQRSSAEVMKITEQAMTHITAARTALAKGDKAAAKRALTQSAASLRKLYDAPELGAVLNQVDEAIASMEGQGAKKPVVNLAPLSASVRRYQLYLDPSVAAGIDEAAAKAKQGDREAAAESLRLARNRMAIDVAYVPVEDAYVRVLAAQQAIDRGDVKQARRFLQNVPIVFAELQLSSPLVPVRFKLNAAALAAEEGNWERSQQLVHEATTELQSIERMSRGTPAASEVSAFVDDVEQLDRQIGSDARPEAQRIRELAKRTQDLGA